jgi:hypothetical protein
VSDQVPEIEERRLRLPRRRPSQDRGKRAKLLAREKAAQQARLRDQLSRERRGKALSDPAEPSGDPTSAPLLKPKFVSPKEFVELTGLSHATVFRRIRDGMLKSTMFGGRRLIDYGEIGRLRDATGD